MDPATVSANAAVVSAAFAIASVVIGIVVAVYIGKQTHLQKKSSDIQIFYSIVQRMEEIRVYRHQLREYKKQHEAAMPPPEEWPEDLKTAADKVCREFDILGLLDRTHYIDSRLVDLFYSVPFADLYKDILDSYVTHLRKKGERGPTHFWELVQFYHRVQYVPENHPGLYGKNDWPRCRRAKSIKI